MTESPSADKPEAAAASPGHLFCFGMGYSAGALADSLLTDGWTVTGTCRSPESAAALEARGIEALLFDATAPLEDIRSHLRRATHVLSSVPPSKDTADPVLEYHFADLADLIDCRWIGYLSTTGVYGDRNGGWVDEDSAQEPTGPRGEARVTAEARWFDLWWDHDQPVHTFRLAGIYGPGRSALDTVRKGKARRINKPGQVFSRIHVDDIVAILRASMDQPRAGGAYNVCDDNPDAPEAVIAYACDLLGAEKPPLVNFEEADLSPMARSFYRDNKRVSNSRIKEELGVKLTWPDYRDALKAMLEAGH